MEPVLLSKQILHKNKTINMEKVSFQYVAQSIVNESIKSAIFIDDKLPGLFKSEDDEEALCQPMYESFQEHQCSLDFFKFDKSWGEKSKLIFERKDLVVLDWELDNEVPAYNSTLKIIDKAVNTDNLHFVCIYSLTPNAIDEIYYKILAYYSGNKSEESTTDVRNIITHAEDELGENGDEIFPRLKDLVKQLTLRAITDSSFNQEFSKLFGKNQGKIRSLVSKLFPSNRIFDSISRFGFALNEEYCYRREFKNVYLICDPQNNYLQINNTLFAVFEKGKHNASELYNHFCRAIINSNENFLTLMSLEIRNKVFERSSFIGKELSKIKEKALFHHMETIEPDTEFEEYLIELWKNYNTGFLYTEKPSIFAVLEDYKRTRGDAENIDNDDLAKLNYHYNIHHNRILDRNVSFGDLFKINKGGNDEYLLCITPHCDCLRPDKINGFYYFVKGQKISIERGLAISDSGYFSFIKEGDNIFCIEWIVKPFTIYLCEKQRNISNVTTVVFGEGVYDFNFLCTIKENYTQRITNKAFSNPMRVGISFARKELDDSCEKYTKRICPHLKEE